MQKIAVLINKNEYKLKQILNLKEYQVEYLDIPLLEFKQNLTKLRTDILIISKQYLANMINLLQMLVFNKEMLIIYISKNLEYGLLYNILNESNFILLEENNVLAINDILRYAVKAYREIRLLNKKLIRLEDDLNSTNLVREAKLKIMKEKKLSEEEAYKYIINLAMQKRIKKSELSKQIIGGLIL